MQIFLTIDISEMDEYFDSLNVERISIDIIYNKNPFLLKSESKKDVYECLLKEIQFRNKNILIGNAIFTIEDVLLLNNVFASRKINIAEIFLPSKERLNYKMNLAIIEIDTIGRNEGITKKEIERNYNLYQNRLTQLFKELQKINIESNFI